MAGWADNYGMTFPVGADPGWNVYDTVWSSSYTPVNVLIAPGMQIVSEEYISDQEIEAVLPL